MNCVSRCLRLVACLLVFSILNGCATTPLDPGDKAVLIMVADLESVGASLPSGYTEYERNRKISRVDGGIELEYSFDARGAGKGYPYIYTSINRETTLSSAAAAYGAMKAGLATAGRSARDDSDRYRYGDWSYFGTLLFDGQARGLIFQMRDDLTVYNLVISGFTMDVDAMWTQLILPRLQMLRLN